MNRVITGISYDLKFLVKPGFPPACGVMFTDIADDGHETPGHVVFVDAEAATMWTATDRIAAANALLDARAKALPDLPTIAARITAVGALEQQEREKRAAAEALDAAVGALEQQEREKRAAAEALDAEIAAKRAALADADTQIAAKQGVLDTLAQSARDAAAA